jgi:hypothetical protein
MKTSQEPGAVAPTAASRSFLHKAIKEIKVVGLVTLLFAIYFGLMILLKRLILAQYEIEFRGLSAALLGALIVAKVVLVLEHVSLGRWLRARPVIVEVVLRTIFYSAGVALVLLLEKAFEARHEDGGFGAALRTIFSHRDIYHVWANVISVGFALLLFNAAAKVQDSLGNGGLPRLFFKTRLEEIELRVERGPSGTKPPAHGPGSE